MTNGWQVYRVGDLLTQNSNNVKVAADKSYKLLGISLEGRGAFLREEKTGDSISAPSLSPVHAGDFIYSRLFAWRGAFDVVSQELDGCFVSNEFPTFKINTEILLPKFLRLYFNRKIVWEEVEKYCTGTTKASRNRFKEQFFLGMEVPLPPLTEQHRIAEGIESLAARVHEALRLREEAIEGREALLHSAMRQIFTPDGAKMVPLETTCAAIIDNLHSNPDYSGDCVVPCIRSSDVGWGELFLETARKTSEAEYTHRTVRGEPAENDIVLVREGGGTGKAALVEKHHRFSLGQRVMMLRPDQSVILPKFLLYQILSPFIYDEQILPLSKGSASPHLNIGALRKFKFILPPLDEQQRIVAYLNELQAKVNALRELQSQSQEELDALLPSVLDRAFKGEL